MQPSTIKAIQAYRVATPDVKSIFTYPLRKTNGLSMKPEIYDRTILIILDSYYGYDHTSNTTQVTTNMNLDGLWDYAIVDVEIPTIVELFKRYNVWELEQDTDLFNSAGLSITMRKLDFEGKFNFKKLTNLDRPNIEHGLTNEIITRIKLENLSGNKS